MARKCTDEPIEIELNGQLGLMSGPETIERQRQEQSGSTGRTKRA